MSNRTWHRGSFRFILREGGTIWNLGLGMGMGITTCHRGMSLRFILRIRRHQVTGGDATAYKVDTRRGGEVHQDASRSEDLQSGCQEIPGSARRGRGEEMRGEARRCEAIWGDARRYKAGSGALRKHQQDFRAVGAAGSIFFKRRLQQDFRVGRAPAHGLGP